MQHFSLYLHLRDYVARIKFKIKNKMKPISNHTSTKNINKMLTKKLRLKKIKYRKPKAIYYDQFDIISTVAICIFVFYLNDFSIIFD